MEIFQVRPPPTFGKRHLLQAVHDGPGGDEEAKVLQHFGAVPAGKIIY